jgi:hypothetical protein
MPEPRLEQNHINQNEISQSRMDLMSAVVKEPTLRAQIRREFDVMKGFADSGIYSSGEVLDDMRYVVNTAEAMRRENKFKNTEHPLGKDGDSLEYLVIDKLAKSHNLFGKNTYIKKTLLLDDWRHGVDAVVEYDSKDKNIGRVALMIDCSNNTSRIMKKLEDNRHAMAIQAGRQVKYFESQIPGIDFKGGVLCVPVVVGVDSVRVNELLDHIGDSNFVAESPVQVAVLLEIKSQLEMYRRIFNTEGWIDHQDSDALYSELTRVSRLIDGNLGERSKLLERKSTRSYLSTDLTFSLITELSDDFGRTIEKTNP